MPSLLDLQGTLLSDNVSWEAVLVNRALDANLLKLERKALDMTAKLRSESLAFVSSNMVQRLAVLVSEYMGGPVADPDNMSRAWRSLSYSLKATLGSMVLPLGSLTIGLARHRALLFKVLAILVPFLPPSPSFDPVKLFVNSQMDCSIFIYMNGVKKKVPYGNPILLD